MLLATGPAMNTLTLSPRRFESGLTIVEMMVALALSLLLAGVLVTAFVASSTSFRVQSGVARIQAGGRFAAEFLAREIRMAGYHGSCLAHDETLINTLNAGYAANFGTYIQGYDATATAWSPSLDASITAQTPTLGSDIVTVRLSGSGIPVTTPYMPTNSADIHVPQDNGLKQYEIAIICNGESGSIFQISNANPSTSGSIVHNTGTGTPGNSTKDLGRKYGANSEIFSLSTHTYYVAPNAQGSTSLWMLASPCPAGDTCPIELVADVERLQLEYGVDTDDDAKASANEFVAASTVADWSKVVAVRISALVRSGDDGLRTAAAALIFNGKSTATDRHLRQVYTSVVQLRNRTP